MGVVDPSGVTATVTKPNGPLFSPSIIFPLIVPATCASRVKGNISMSVNSTFFIIYFVIISLLLKVQKSLVPFAGAKVQLKSDIGRAHSRYFAASPDICRSDISHNLVWNSTEISRSSASRRLFCASRISIPEMSPSM